MMAIKDQETPLTATALALDQPVLRLLADPMRAQIVALLAVEQLCTCHLVDATGPHEVVVEFSSDRALLASSRTWHVTQRIEQLRDGGVRIAMRVPHLAPVVSWILEWGPHARAFAPAELVEQVKAELDQARAQYS